MSKLKSTVAGIVALTGAANAQVALDQTTTQTGEQIYKTIVFANGSENEQPHPSYSIIGNKNIDPLASEGGGEFTGFVRANAGGGWTGVEVYQVGPIESTTIDNEMVGGHTISWDEATATQATLQSHENELGINYTGTEKAAFADINGDGLPDALGTYYSLPTGQAAWDAGFQIGDLALFATPHIVNWDTGGTLLAEKNSFKVLQEDGLWYDTPQGPEGWDESDIIDWISEPLSTSEVNSIKTTIYPNPASDKVFVKTDNNQPVGEYRIVDMTGKALLKGKNLDNNEGINIQDLPAGLYILQAKVNDKIVTHKVMKK